MKTPRRSTEWHGKLDKPAIWCSFDARLANDAAGTGWQPDPPHYTRGCAQQRIYFVLHADTGTDQGFLVSKKTRTVTKESQQ